MSCEVQTVDPNFMKPSLPLRSVENYCWNMLATPPGSPRAKPGGGRLGKCSPSQTRINGMNTSNNNVHNNNVNGVKSYKIRTEPFSDNYDIEEDIGRGKFAVVRRCRCKASNQPFAAKFIRKRRKGKDCRSDIMQEIAILEMARGHRHLVRLVEVFETTQELIIVTEYAAGGELFTPVIREQRLEEVHVKRLMRQILDGLRFLHDHSIVHLDVKPQNILLTSPFPIGDIKLCDFGFARKVHSGDDVRDIVGTPDYVAPEVLAYDPIQTASDIWSVGALAYVLLSGYSPFQGDTVQETFLNIAQVNLDFPEDLFYDVSEEAMDFISYTLVRDPSDRPSVRECLSHPWLQLAEPPKSLATTSAAAGPAASCPSPSGSPLGCRRARTPPTPDGILDSEPSKKTKCKDTHYETVLAQCSSGAEDQLASDCVQVDLPTAPDSIDSAQSVMELNDGAQKDETLKCTSTVQQGTTPTECQQSSSGHDVILDADETVTAQQAL